MIDLQWALIVHINSRLVPKIMGLFFTSSYIFEGAQEFHPCGLK